MSDVNDDLLNYELGDLDDHDLGDDDEDELLLSDDETETAPINKKSTKNAVKNVEQLKPPIIESNRTEPDQIVENLTDTSVELEKSDKETSERDENIENVAVDTVDLSCESSATQSMTPTSQIIDLSVSTPITIGSTSNSQLYSPSQNVTPQSQCDSQTTEVSSSERGSTDDQVVFETEDSDEQQERFNPKLCAEREIDLSPEFRSDVRPMYQKRPLRGHMVSRGGPYPPRYRPPYPYPNENFISQFSPRLPGPPHPSVTGGMPPGIQPLHPMHPGDYRSGPPPSVRPNFIGSRPLGRPPPPRHFGGPPQPFQPFNGTHHRHHRPPLRFDGSRPPRMPPVRFMQQQPQQQQQQQQMRPIGPGVGPSPPGNPNNFQIQVPSMAQQSNQPGPGGMIARKVLINPNFKGGVEAATTQLMMDTLNSQQYQTAQQDAELLRQQEAFINQNRRQIERRLQNARTPERDRSYSPPVRRERRADSRDRDHRPAYRRRYPEDGDDRTYGKRRRSVSPDRKKDDQKVEEDEETRAYRLEIEKQKALREKMLRDKEMRRRKAAEEKKDDEPATSQPQPPTQTATPQKLTPIVVTTKKIISLKKKSSDQSSSAESSPKKSTAKSAPLNQTVAAVRQLTPPPMVTTNNFTIKKFVTPIDEYEDELLADSPSPPPPATESKSNIFSNRRVILKSNQSDKSGLATKSTKSDGNVNEQSVKSKGIFDRLERKVAVTDATKRKIQRIVINNAKD